MKSFLLFSVLFISFSAFNQTQGIAYSAVGKGVATTFVTDYHCLGINTSALGWGTGYSGKYTTIGMTEFGFGIYSDAMSSEKLKRFFGSIKNQALGNNPAPYDWNAQREAAGDYAQAGISMFLNLNWFGFAYQNEKFGGIAFNIQENYQWYSKFNEKTTDMLFRGKYSSYFDSLQIVVNGDTSMIANSSNLSLDTLNAVILGSIAVPLKLSEITNGSEIRSVWNRYYNFGYGRKLFGKDSVFEVYGGVGGRFIQSMAMFNMESNENGLYMYSSVSPRFSIDYGNVALSNPSSISQTGNFPKSVGNGYGIDLSLSAILFNKLKIAASVNNIGQVVYNRNVYRVNDTLFSNVSVNGLTDYNVTQSINQLLRDGGLLTLQGQEKYVLKNAADFRFGASMDFGKLFTLGVDVVAPFDRNRPGSISNPVFSIGGELRPMKWLCLSAGYFGGGIYRSNVPVGIKVVLKDGAYEFGISSYDALSFFLKSSNSLSAAMGVVRVRF
jgi:hypothetical protein